MRSNLSIKLFHLTCDRVRADTEPPEMILTRTSLDDVAGFECPACQERVIMRFAMTIAPLELKDE